MDWIALSVLVVTTLLLWTTGRRPAGFPPGPAGFPLLGYCPFLVRNPHLTLTALGQKYGGVFSVPLITGHAVVLNDWESIKAALVDQSSVFSGRPPSLISEVFIKNTDIGFSSGIGWKERRRFAMQHIKHFGFGKGSMEEVIVAEVNQLLTHLQSLGDGKMTISDLFFFPLMNIIWMVVGGKQFNYDDEYMKEFSKALDQVFVGFSNTNLANFLLVLRHLPGSGFREFRNAQEKLIDFVTKEVEEHSATYREGQLRDFIDVYLAEIDKLAQTGDPAGPRSFQKKNLISVVWDLFLAGIETGSTNLSWAFLYMITWPEIQLKVQQELDDVVGRERLPSYEDRIRLPYTEAVLLEVSRFATIGPLSIAHYTMAPAQLSGYTIPKSTVILENIWAVHHDPKLWGDPDVFRPERFLDASGKVQKVDYLIPFSVGSRACPGKTLAMVEAFLFFTCLLHKFSFCRVDGEEPLSLECLFGLTLKPKAFSATVKQR